MKKCCTCHKWLDKSEFNKQAAAWDGLQSRCRACSRAWYEANKAQHIKKVRVVSDAAKVRNRELVRQYLTNHSCVDCGESDLRVLDFDHREGEHKKADVARLVASSFSSSVIRAEIEKCDVRCANCHRIITCKRAGNWRQKAVGRRLGNGRE